MLDACCGTPAVSRSDKPIGQAPADHERGKGRNEICTCRQRLKLSHHVMSHRCLSSQIWICMAANAGYRSKGKRTACVSHQCVRWEGQSFAKCMGRASQSLPCVTMSSSPAGEGIAMQRDPTTEQVGPAKCMAIHDDFEIIRQQYHLLLVTLQTSSDQLHDVP